MNFSYYPGCTLKTKAKELDESAKKCAKALGVNLNEIENWQCCGGVYPIAKDEIATKLSSVRTLVTARDKGEDLVTVCSACHNVVKRVNYDIKNDENIKLKVNNYLNLDVAYEGETNVIHYLEMLRDKIGFDKISKMVKNPLKDRKIGAYYGCLLLRPSKEMEFDNPENPTIIEDFIKALGATPIVYEQRNECCGGYVVMEDKSFAKKRCSKIFQSANEHGANELVTACPLCMYNLKDQNSSDYDINVTYFTTLLQQALGL
ncbi:MAG: CoB--CoM heterodisulfide reductase iron-sulfur subunit B family protein [Oscillospiraceae bacterium]